jgi:hypothetical protein
MASQILIPNVRLSGNDVNTFSKVPAGTEWVLISIDRAVAGGLNSLTTADTLTVNIDRSMDNGATWALSVAGIAGAVGGVLVTKGVTRRWETITVGVPGDGATFRISTIAPTPVRIAGTVDYTP